MKPKFITLFTFITALTLAVINTAGAADFTFTVPVQLNNLLRGVTHYAVVCHVGTSPNTANIGAQASPTFSVDVNSGNITNPGVTVEVNASQGMDPSTATHYDCVLRFRIGDSWWLPGPSVTAAEARPKSGTPFTPLVNGTITP